MKLDELLEQTMARAKDMKEHTVAQAATEGWNPDIKMIVEGFRGDRPVIMLMPLDTGRDEVLRAGYAAATMFGCDTLSITHESWQTGERLNPLTGKDWEVGDMQDLAENHDGIAKGWIAEALMSYAVNRAGDLVSGFQKFVMHGDNENGYTVEWTETQVLPAEQSGVQHRGVIPESLVSFMNAPTVMQFMAKAGVTGDTFGLTPVQAQAHSDCAAIKYLPQFGFRGMAQLMSDEEERSAVIEESLGEQMDWTREFLARVRNGEEPDL